MSKYYNYYFFKIELKLCLNINSIKKCFQNILNVNFGLREIW